MKQAWIASLPVMAGYVVLGIGFGIILNNNGYSWIWSTVMAITIYAGSMQYVTANLLAKGASLLAVALMTLMVNLRHIFYGITMLEDYKVAGKEKPYLIFALTDETFSLVCSPKLEEGVSKRGYYFWVSLFNQLYWIFGCTIGSILASAVNFQFKGVDFSMTALFVVIFVEQWESQKNHLPAITGVCASVICLLLFGSSDFLIPAMILITVLLFVEKRWILSESDDKTRKNQEGESE